MLDYDCDCRAFGAFLVNENKAEKCCFVTYDPDRHKKTIKEINQKLSLKNFNFIDFEKDGYIDYQKNRCDYFISCMGFCWNRNPRLFFRNINKVLKKNKQAKVLFLNQDSYFYQTILKDKITQKLIYTKEEGLIKQFKAVPVLFPYDDFFIMAYEEGFDVKNINSISPKFENFEGSNKEKLIQIGTLAKK